MGITNSGSGTRVDEVADGIYRISTPVPPSAIPGGFSFNQYLLVDDEPLLFHTGMKRLFPLVREAIDSVIPATSLRWIAFGHHETDENGALAELLSIAPAAQPLVGRMQAMLCIEDICDRAPKVLADGESHALGARRVTWIDAPHVPHGWDSGFLFESHTETLLCGDLFTQPGHDNPPLTEGDVLEPAEALRKAMPYWSCGAGTRGILERLAATEPSTLACMHGSAFRGNGAALIRALADRLGV